jgi:gamma-glutamylcyclotransferase
MSNFYFAYGSNMNPARVEQRRMRFEDCFGGVLQDYRLAFNKRSVKYPGAASANVVPHSGGEVEGVLYRLSHPSQIEVMDPYEGYPVRYSRYRLPVVRASEVVEAWVYIANREFIVEGLRPARWYLDHLLAARPHLSDDYFAGLAATETLPNSDIEPQ